MHILKRIGHWLVIGVATLWLVIDVLFLSIVRPIREHIMAWWWMQKLRKWVCALGPHSSLALFLIPLLVLEPVKPVGALLFHRGHHVAATSVVVVGELVKLATVDQLFEMTKPKLMTFRWLAWAYSKWRTIVDLVRAPPFRRMVHHWLQAVRRRMHDI